MSKYLKFATPAAAQAEDLKSRFGISNHGLVHVDRVYWNLPAPALYEEAIFRNEGFIAHGGPLVVNTGKWSARAAQPSSDSINVATPGSVSWLGRALTNPGARLSSTSTLQVSAAAHASSTSHALASTLARSNIGSQGR